MPIPPGDARPHLNETLVEGWKNARKRGALLLSPGANHAYRLLTAETVGSYYVGDDSIVAITNALDSLSDKERAAAFNVICPGMGVTMNAVWKFSAGMPYQGSGYRKPFRCPGKPIVARASRFALLQSLEYLFHNRKATAAWYAVWAPYLEYYRLQHLGIFLATAIDAGGEEGEEVFQILKGIAEGTHREGAMGHHVIVALLNTARPDAWPLVQNLLLNAQRQEGLRQAILESVDEASAIGFQQVLRLIVEHDLARFSSVFRASLTWGLPIQESAKGFYRCASRALELLGDAGARRDAALHGDKTEVHLALWAEAFYDVQKGLEIAADVLRRDDPEIRMRGVQMVSLYGVTMGIPHLKDALRDPDARVAALAVGGLKGFNMSQLLPYDLFSDVLATADRLPMKWDENYPAKQDAWDILTDLATDKQLPLIAHLVPGMYPGSRMTFLRRCKEGNQPGLRPLMFKYIADPSQGVREMAFTYLEQSSLNPKEAIEVEAVLGRKASDLRVAAMKLLRTQPKAGLLQSADRLLGSAEEPKRVAGLELLADLHQAGQEVARIEKTLTEFQKGEKLSENERTQLERVLKPSDSELLKVSTAFGLADFSTLPVPEKPKRCPGPFATPASLACIRELDNLIHEHRDLRYKREDYWGNTEEKVLGESMGAFPLPKVGLSIENQWEKLPAGEVWLKWLETRGPNTRDADGLELLRAMGSLWTLNSLVNYDYSHGVRRIRLLTVPDGVEQVAQVKVLADLKYPEELRGLIKWLVVKEKVSGADLAIDAWQSLIALNYERKYAVHTDSYYVTESSWRRNGGLMPWLDIAQSLRDFLPEHWRPEHDIRLYRLLKFYDEPEFQGRKPASEEPKPGKRILGIEFPSKKQPEPERIPPPCEEVLRASAAGGLSDVEIYDAILSTESTYRGVRYPRAILQLTQRYGRAKMPKSDTFDVLLQRVIDRIVDVSITRGDLPTEACLYAEAVKSGISLKHLVSVVMAAKGLTWDRAGFTASNSKASVFSSLVRHSRPEPEDTPERFKVLLGHLKDKELVELAMFAPQWAKHAEFTTGWEGLEDAVWWMHAHTKDDQWGVDKDLKDGWTSQIAERTPLDAESLMSGAVDTAWFLGFRTKFDEKRWKVIDSAAKLASSGAGHKRAQRFADAMLGRVSLEELKQAIAGKRHQDSVRAFGLVPVQGEDDVLERYQFLQQFRKESRQFGSMKQTSEKLAVSIAMDNLARTAGYPDPVRLQWAMEAREIEDLKSGSIEVASGDLSVTLSILPTGEPEITAARAGKEIKEVPAKDKKDPAIKHLFDRRKEVQAQAKRMRWSLESAMIRGDAFTGGEMRNLMEHPVLAPMLRTLVFVDARGTFGFPSPTGELMAAGGELFEAESARLAHPFDFLDRGLWAEWQRIIFASETVQPFKQVFRELYIPTELELEAADRSQRYTGHQLNPRQALGILGKRGWAIGGEEGVRKVLHEHRIVAHLTFEESFYTPADVEGLTIDSVYFSPTGDWKPLPIADISPRIFSETMRDLDLIVSVAHMGGYDPETSESSVEMRAGVVRETVRLMGFQNVAFDLPRVQIQGKLAEYTVHMGSGNIHKCPGGEIVAVPIHSQHRGRMFLPFMDDDPKTAEIVSKVLLLAEDEKIKDPSIVSQILR